jgi:hypothetical protein
VIGAPPMGRVPRDGAQTKARAPGRGLTGRRLGAAHAPPATIMQIVRLQSFRKPASPSLSLAGEFSLGLRPESRGLKVVKTPGCATALSEACTLSKLPLELRLDASWLTKLPGE